jgi:cyclase
MLAKRLIARLDIKGESLIKGINLEGLRVLGAPNDFAVRYYAAGIDEILYMDAVASLYDRNSLRELISVATRNIFVPLTVGGGIRTVDDAKSVLRAGADKVALNTAAISSPQIISELAENFGSQCVVISIEAKKNPSGGWQAYIENGRQPTGVDVSEWATRAEELGAGEILLTSIDQEGTRRGMDLDLIASVTKNVSIPVIVVGTGFLLIPIRCTSSPTLHFPCSTVPVTTVPLPEMFIAPSTDIRKSLSFGLSGIAIFLSSASINC